VRLLTARRIFNASCRRCFDAADPAALRQDALVGLRLRATCLFVAPQQSDGACMRDGDKSRAGLPIAQGSFGGWRIVASAWLVAIVFVVLLAGVETLASQHASPRAASLAGAVIPRHDPGFVGPDEVAASDWQERARAEADAGW
jgi:hypothetical protein